ncbi:putative E3 ubiquitin-protein ligase UBR7 isoform X2 [Aphelenchoides fujianensis]|nr:putative E3 ubiquitin-protein ligase UBR7 isoform X2 [Aphelenchoides fujianensis]
MSDDEHKSAADRMLADGVVTGAAWKQLADEFERDEETERVINGPLSMVCTYPEGYKERQAVYACRTCEKETGQPYPPPEDDPTYESEMSQCVMCEDWFHEEHLGLEEGVFDEDGVEVVCAACADKFPFLRPYAAAYEREFVRVNGPLGANRAADETADQTAATNENTLNESTASTPAPAPAVMFAAPPAAESTAAAEDANASTASTRRRQLVIVDNRRTAESGDCVFRQPAAEETRPAGALWFATCDWRLMLCRCPACKRVYEDHECEWLLEEGDSLTHYLNANAAELEKTRREPEDELFDEVAKRSNADVAHTVVAEMAIMKRKLGEFISEMAARDKTITDADVRGFFDELATKRRRLDEPEDEA